MRFLHAKAKQAPSQSNEARSVHTAMYHYAYWLTLCANCAEKVAAQTYQRAAGQSSTDKHGLLKRCREAATCGCAKRCSTQGDSDPSVNAVRNCIADLSRDQRECLALSLCAELATSEIVALTGNSREVVLNHLASARAFLYEQSSVS